MILRPKTRSQAPLVHTYSIVAVDEQACEMGVAVQSHYFSVGSVVPWGEAGVGVVATQAEVNVNYGPEGLRHLRNGKSPKETLAALLEADAEREHRQVALAAPGKGVAVHTGSQCIRDAGHHEGETFTVQANLMRRDAVWPAMARAYSSHEGHLADRLMAALEAGEAAGGDIRGKQSAAMLIVGTTATGNVLEDRRLDLRVEDHSQPLEELRRLISIRRAYDHAANGDEALARGDITAATREFELADALQPENVELRYWRALTLATTEQIGAAEELLRQIYAVDDSWRELTRRLAGTELIPLSQEQMARLADA